MGSRKQGERSKDPEVGRSQQESDERFSAAELGVGGVILCHLQGFVQT